MERRTGIWLCFIPRSGPFAVHGIHGKSVPGAAGSDRALLLWVQNLALLTTGAELEFSQALSVSKLSSIGHSVTKTVQFQEKHISMYFSWTLWLLTRTKSTSCSTTKDCLMSYLIKCYFHCFLCFPPQ